MMKAKNTNESVATEGTVDDGEEKTMYAVHYVEVVASEHGKQCCA